MPCWITSIQETFQQALEKRTLNACQYSPENLHALITVVCEFIAKVHANCSRPEAPLKSLVEAQVKRQVQGLLRAWLEEDRARGGSQNRRHGGKLGDLRAGAGVEPGEEGAGIIRRAICGANSAADRAQPARGESKK